MTAPDPPLLEVEGLTVRLRSRRGLVNAVNGLSYRLRRGETLGIVGESGSGKTVGSLAIMGLLPKWAARSVEGRILLDGVDLIRLPGRQMRRVRGGEVSMIFQDPLTSLNPSLTVERQLTEVIQEHRGVGRHQARDRAVTLLDLVGISEAGRRLFDYPHQFSGGMRQRVMIAMALACDPRLIIADEPTTALDVTIQAQVLDLLRKTVVEQKTALILITHDLGVVAGLCERVLVMYGGRVVEEATTRALFHNPRHPYTLALMSSMPRLDTPRTERMRAIKGQPPDGTRQPPGCPFAPRCVNAQDDCRQAMPPLVEIGSPSHPHRLACYHPVGSES